MSYYKDPNFDERKPLRVIYKGQPAVDTGGVARQFFTNLLNKVSEMFFEGDAYQSPVYNAGVVASGIMKYIGKIIVHSILQGGPGFPIFSPSVYRYFSTGNFELAMRTANIGECTAHIKNFIDQIDDADDVQNLDQDECLNIMSECGLTEMLTNENKRKIIQLLIIHDVIGGLNTLGFRDKMKEFPDKFQELFVPCSEQEMSPSAVVDVLEFPDVLNECESTIANNLQQFILNADHPILEKFLIFTTGSTRLPNFGLGKIKVKFNNATSFFASTCLFSVTLPNQLIDQKSFNASLKAVLESSKQSFTSP
ncbi:uncharacterized protein LOC124453910 [Xenia sp. Carnegie-2017]|uniref:uncharacterized protein LOC124453910 n=1 Tax=Xenia sp. Carnegie-2017 TaxID=2897299 RepID=UPI001F039742|nr:uncharacterized protein LOC124453910 [Xenia sp. Carnegie-2017]